MLRFVLFIIFFIISGCVSEEDKIEARDSYIDAYYESHGILAENHAELNKNDRKSSYYEHNSLEYYGPPHGYLEPTYPSSNYGPPVPVYGPPNHPRYTAIPLPIYGVPHAMMGLLDKLHLKLDIYTILKIILKLVIFKKIVGFIALICLLLFIPKFKTSKNEVMDDDDSRFFKNNSKVNEKLNTLTQYVLNAIDNYSDNNLPCTGANCVIRNMLHNIDRKYSYDSLFTKYSEEENVK